MGMANMAVPSVDFQNIAQGQLETAIASFTWLNPPEKYSIDPGKGLCIVPKEKTDFWRRTYGGESPPADRSSGHALLYRIPSSVQSWECTTQFSLTPSVQYDQAGLMVFVNNTHWIKAGIEFENDSPQMSCVVTNGESDWNYLLWPTDSDAKIRVIGKQYKNVCECKVEYEQDGVWKFLRESPLILPSSDRGSDASIGVGLMCCAPLKEGEAGMNATFRFIKYSLCSHTD